MQVRGTPFSRGFPPSFGLTPLMITVLTNWPKNGWAVISVRASMLYAVCTCLRSVKCKVANAVFDAEQRRLFVRRKAGKDFDPAKSMTAKRISLGMPISERSP